MAKLSRRALMRSMVAGSAGLVLAACQPKVVEVTKIVEKEVEVEKVVKETVVVKEAVEVEKEVTRVVEKQVQAPKEPITLIIQHPHPSYEKFGAETADPQFEEMNPGVTVKREFTAGYVKEFYPKLMTMHVGGVAWDVAELPSWAGTEYELYMKGILRELTPFIEKDQFDMGVFFEVAAKGASFRGLATFMLPILVDPGQSALVYNMELLEKAGVPEPTPDWRYDVEFKEALIELKKAGGEETWNWLPQVSGTFGYQALFDAWNTALLDETGRKLLLDSEPNMEALTFINQLFENETVPRFGTMPGGANAMMIAGQLAFETTFAPVCPWRIAAIEGKFDARATLMPKGPAPSGKNGGSANPHYMGMGSNSKSPDMAWEYLKWFTSEELGDPLWDAGLVPARIDTWRKKAVGDLPIWGLSEKLLHTVQLSSIPWNYRGGEVDDTLVNGLDKVWLGELSLQEGVDETSKNIIEILDKGMV